MGANNKLKMDVSNLESGHDSMFFKLWDVSVDLVEQIV
jgi:hypothetical protein